MARHWQAGAAGLAVLGLTLTACGGAKVGDSSAAGSGSSGKCGTFNLAVNPWVGYEADAAVVGYVLQHELGCTVVKKNIDEQTSWQGFPTGEVDAILENWGHEDLAAKYITTDKTAQDAGQTGNEGIIGWYIPKFFADANPDILTTKTNPQILNKYADQFKTSESGGKGQILMAPVLEDRVDLARREALPRRLLVDVLLDDGAAQLVLEDVADDRGVGLVAHPRIDRDVDGAAGRHAGRGGG